MPARPTAEWRAASDRLAAVAPVTSALATRHGTPPLGRVTPVAERFEALASSIAHQQLAGRAAATIWSRVRAAVGEPFEPRAVLAVDPGQLRAAGLSGAKTAALTDLATKTHDGIVRLDRIGRLSDHEVVEHLTVVRGIGRWTAQMFLLFQLGRLDIWPTGDLGVRSGFAAACDLPALPSERELESLGAPYAPYRSVLAWWCWREADTVTR